MQSFSFPRFEGVGAALSSSTPRSRKAGFEDDLKGAELSGECKTVVREDLAGGSVAAGGEFEVGLGGLGAGCYVSGFRHAIEVIGRHDRIHAPGL